MSRADQAESREEFVRRERAENDSWYGRVVWCRRAYRKSENAFRLLQMGTRETRASGHSGSLFGNTDVPADPTWWDSTLRASRSTTRARRTTFWGHCLKTAEARFVTLGVLRSEALRATHHFGS